MEKFRLQTSEVKATTTFALKINIHTSFSTSKSFSKFPGSLVIFMLQLPLNFPFVRESSQGS